MRSSSRIFAILFLGLAAPLVFAAASPGLSPHRLFRVTLDGAAATTVSGRLLVFATPLKAAEAASGGRKITRVDAGEFGRTTTAVAATEVAHLAPDGSVILDADALAYPKPFSSLANGTYVVQAVLDRNHNYNYNGRGAGDLVSPVMTITFGDATGIPTLPLKRELTRERHAWTAPPWVQGKARTQLDAALKTAKQHTTAIDFTSSALTAFWGRPMAIKGWVLVPPGYNKDAAKRYPTVYYTHGFGGTLDGLTAVAGSIWAQMTAGEMPPMIWVFLSEASPRGTHEFADSVNNGPWGQALTTELIPHLEAQYRMDGDVGGRFLTGHSSGGWATLWLQVRYPKVFGGTWSTSPDPSDFHDFTGVNLYAPHANVYYKPDGSLRPLVRANGKVVATYKEFAQLERVLGPYGGQMASFEWVFSPRGADGRPVPMFNRDTGVVNPKVVHYWRDHYDIAYRIKTQWPELKPTLNGKIHLIVGTADTYYLDGAAHKLKAVLDSVGARAEVEFLPGKTHSSVMVKGENRHWLMQQIAWAMYHQARPKATIPTQYRDEIKG